jgi:hypothetical protein
MPDIWMDVDVALAEVPVNLLPLIDDTDFKAIEAAVAYNAAGMALRWHFVTCAGAYTVTSVTPTTGGNYDWTDQGDSGIYTIEIPASGGASINNDTEGFGWFTGVATGILPWRGPVIGFRASGLNDAMIEGAWSATRGLAGTALPAAAADAAGGLPISDAGGLDLDAIKVRTDRIPNVAAGASGGLLIAGSNAATTFASVTITAGLSAATISTSGTVTLNALTVTTGTTLSGAVSLGSTLGITGIVTATAANDFRGVKLGGILATALTETSAGYLAAGFKKLFDVASPVLTAASVNQSRDLTDAVLATAVWNAATASYGTAGSYGLLVETQLDAAITSRQATVANLGTLVTDWTNGGRLDVILDARASQASVDTIDSIVDAIVIDTSEIGTAGAGLTALPWNAAWDAQVQSEVDDALAAFAGDTGITLAKALEMLAAFMAGKVAVSSVGGVSTYTYKKRDGSTTSFSAACSEVDGTRATTGSLT